MLLLFFNISQHLFMKIALYIGVWVVPFLYTHIRLKKHGAIELYSIPLQWLFLLGLEYVFPKFLGLKISDDSIITIGIPIGVSIILLAFALTGIYVILANKEFDQIEKKILKKK